MDVDEEFENKKRELEEVREQKKKLLELQNKTSLNLRANSNLESQLSEKSKLLALCNKKRDSLERKLATAKSEAAGIKRILELERQERRELENRTLILIKGAKRKWENSEKGKIALLNKQIESQTIQIAKLCTSNNEMSAKLQKAESELKTSTDELKKLRNFQIQYKESLAKMRECSRLSAQGVEKNVKQMATRAHNQLTELREKLELETSRCTDLENKLRNEQDSNHCRQSRLNIALAFTQSELKDCKEQIKKLKATIPAQDAEMEELKKKLILKTKQVEIAVKNEKTLICLHEQTEKIIAENELLKNKLQATESNLCDCLKNLKQKETIILGLERIKQDKTNLELQLRTSLQKEEELKHVINNLEELRRKLQESTTKLVTENAALKELKQKNLKMDINSELCYHKEKISQLKHKIQVFEHQLETVNENLVVEQKKANETQILLWKKEKELSNANLEQRIAARNAKTAEEEIKTLQDERLRLTEELREREKDEEKKSIKLLKEMENAKASLEELTKESTRNRIQADFAQQALTRGNKQIEELQNLSSSLQRELDLTHKQIRGNQGRVDSFKSENEYLKLQISKQNDVKNEYESKVQKLQEELNTCQVNNVLLKETCTVLEEQLTDFERLTKDHEIREDTLVEEKVKLLKELGTSKSKLRECKVAQNEERKMRLVAERAIENLRSETSDIEQENGNLTAQRDEYKMLAQKLSKQTTELSTKCGDLECDLSQMKRLLDIAKKEAVIVKEESSQHLSRLHELKEVNMSLVSDLQENVDQGQELKIRVTELEDVMGEMRQFYQEREVKSGSTCQQQTKLIDYLQLKLEESSKKKKGVCDKIFRLKQKENIPPAGNTLTVGYRELENQLEKEKVKVKALTEQLLNAKIAKVSSPKIAAPLSEKSNNSNAGNTEDITRNVPKHETKHNPHLFNIDLSLRAEKCAVCSGMIHLGKEAAICSGCQVTTHIKCSVFVPATCAMTEDFTIEFGKYTKFSLESLSSVKSVQSVKTLGIDEPDLPERDTDYLQKSSKILTENQSDEKKWLKALQSLSNKTAQIDKYQTVLKLEKNQLDLNCIVEMPKEVLLIGAEEGLYSYKHMQDQVLMNISGVKKVYQLTLHPNLELALMIAEKDRQLVSSDLNQLKNCALAAESSHPTIRIKSILASSENCHLYQVHEELLCVATSSHIILLKWMKVETSGEFIGIREVATQEPCSCALFIKNALIVGCNKFFQIDLATYEVDDFTEKDNFMRTEISNVSRLGVFPIYILDVSGNSENVELLLCYNEFGVFVDEYGQRTRSFNPYWSHLPFAFEYRTPYLFVIHFSSIEIIKIEPDSFKLFLKRPERTFVELNNPRYLGLAGSKGIYVSTVNSILELLKIEGISLTPRLSGGLTRIDSSPKNEDSTSEFSFTSSLLEVLDGQGKKSTFD